MNITQLRAAGTAGVVSYRRISNVEAVDESRIREAARNAGVDGLILAKLVRVEEKTEYSGPYFPWTWLGVYGSHGGVSMGGLGGSPSASRYSEYTTETTLIDVVKNEPVCQTATLVARQTVSGENAIKSTVQTVVKALAENNLLRRQQ